MILVPTSRLAAVVAAGAVALVPGATRAELLPLGLVYNLLVIALCLADLWSLPAPAALRLERRLPRGIGLGSAHVVRLVVNNRSARAVDLVLRDTVPRELGEVADPPPLRVAAGATARAEYLLRPPRRGRFVLGGVTLRWTGLLGLLQRQAHYPLRDEVCVYPDLRAIQRYDMLERAGRLLATGIRAARMRGAGTEFESLREYRSDDDSRRIDWSATARRGRMTSRQYEVERSQTVLLCVDVGRLMTARLDDQTRLDHAISAALLLANVALRQQDRVGLLVFGEEPLSYLPPRPGRAQLAALLEALFDQQGRLAEPDYGAALRFVGLRQRKRSLVTVFSDLVDTEASRRLLGAVTGLRPAHLPLFVSVRDPALDALAAQPSRDSTAVYERALAAERLSERAQALRLLRAGGVRVVDAPPAAVPAELVNRYVEAKVQLLL